MATDEEFRKSKEKGLKFELILLDYLRKSDPKAEVIGGMETRFDIVCPTIKKTYEAKYDYKAKETGQFAIEVEYEGKPSGIYKSEADIWVLYDGEFAFFMAREALMEIIKRGYFKTWTGKVEGMEMKKLLFLPRDTLSISPYVEIIKLDEQH